MKAAFLLTWSQNQVALELLVAAIEELAINQGKSVTGVDVVSSTKNGEYVYIGTRSAH